MIRLRGFQIIAALAAINSIALLAGAAEPAIEKGIEYANPDNQHLQLDLARPSDGAAPFPAIVCIHGGGFRAGKREHWDAMCQDLAAQGFVAVTITYRLAPKYQFPAAVEDCKAAVRWLRANADKYHVDPKRIGVLGDSAGGHLTQFLAVTNNVRDFDGDQNPGPPSTVQCAVSWYGPCDFTLSYGKSVDAAEVLPMFLGGNLEQQRKRHILASPLYWVTPDVPPILLMHGTDDKYVNYEQSTLMRDRLKAAMVDVELITFQGAGHGFKGDDAKRANAAAIEFLKKRLQG
ncbi:MAG TPA: alpha/beta hydrolase [Tepidisphaeraceae bacterium]|jgi:acetyl esterase/lipase|nr:alpha/beta hydrolase [Tepidisphaeraceae bacterium]